MSHSPFLRREEEIASVGAGPQHLPDWITAISTFATAVVTTIATVVASLSFKRSISETRPIIEVRFSHDPKEMRIGFHFVIRNRLYEDLIIDSVAVSRPRNMTIDAESFEKGVLNIKRTSDRVRKLRWVIGPRGQQKTQTLAGDALYRSLNFSVPSDWGGGAVKLRFRNSSAAWTIRDKRITIKRQIKVAPKTQTEQKLSNQD